MLRPSRRTSTAIDSNRLVRPRRWPGVAAPNIARPRQLRCPPGSARGPPRGGRGPHASRRLVSVFAWLLVLQVAAATAPTRVYSGRKRQLDVAVPRFDTTVTVDGTL